MAVSSISFQDALMSLAASSSMRTAFQMNVSDRARRLGCSQEDTAILAELPPEQLERYARSLIGKRWLEVRRALPLSLRVCPSLRAYYQTWLADHPARATTGVLAPGPREALRAVQTLSAAIVSDASNADYAPDLLRFEVLGRCSALDGQPRELRSRFSVHELVQTLQAGSIPFDPKPTATHYRFTTRVDWRRV